MLPPYGSSSTSTKASSQQSMIEAFNGTRRTPSETATLSRSSPRYDQTCSSARIYSTSLDSRGAISVTERVGVIQRVRTLAVGLAQALDEVQNHADKQEAA